MGNWIYVIDVMTTISEVAGKCYQEGVTETAIVIYFLTDEELEMEEDEDEDEYDCVEVENPNLVEQSATFEISGDTKMEPENEEDGKVSSVPQDDDMDGDSDPKIDNDDPSN